MYKFYHEHRFMIYNNLDKVQSVLSERSQRELYILQIHLREIHGWQIETIMSRMKTLN